VLYFSTHRYEHGTYWPNLEESNYNWIGTGDGIGFNCNIPLNRTGMGNTEFLTVWHQVLLPLAYKVSHFIGQFWFGMLGSLEPCFTVNLIECCAIQFNPDLVIVSAGYDAALGCPEVNVGLLEEMMWLFELGL